MMLQQLHNPSSTDIMDFLSLDLCPNIALPEKNTIIARLYKRNVEGLWVCTVAKSPVSQDFSL